MELPDPYLPGAISLLDQLDKRLIVLLRDGRTLIGCLRTIDQFANLILDEVCFLVLLNYNTLTFGSGMLFHIALSHFSKSNVC